MNDNLFTIKKVAKYLRVSERSVSVRKTRPEIHLLELLVSHSFSDFEMHLAGILGHPDFYFVDRKKTVFVDGCF